MLWWKRLLLPTQHWVFYVFHLCKQPILFGCGFFWGDRRCSSSIEIQPLSLQWQDSTCRLWCKTVWFRDKLWELGETPWWSLKMNSIDLRGHHLILEPMLRCSKIDLWSVIQTLKTSSFNCFKIRKQYNIKINVKGQLFCTECPIQIENPIQNVSLCNYKIATQWTGISKSTMQCSKLMYPSLLLSSLGCITTEGQHIYSNILLFPMGT